MIAYDKLKGLIRTEKSNFQVKEGKYYFRVDKSCRKQEISFLIKKAFGFDAKKVNIVNVKSKSKVFRGLAGSRGSYKKAIVTLDKDQVINFDNK